MSTPDATARLPIFRLLVLAGAIFVSVSSEFLPTGLLPDMAAAFTPLVYAVPVQLLAYHTAVVMGTDVDQPRNLAKSVTVE